MKIKFEDYKATNKYCFVNEDFTVDIMVDGEVENYPLIPLYGELWIQFRKIEKWMMKD